MDVLKVRDMTQDDEYFVGTCSHINESEEIDACSGRRIAWLKEMKEKGLFIKVALLNNEHAGFLYLIPLEVSPWGPLGRDLMTIPCLWVIQKAQKKGIGRALVKEAEKTTQNKGRKGLVVQAYNWDFWFMPASFFEKQGFSMIKRRQLKTSNKAEEVMLWKVFDSSVETPEFLERKFKFRVIKDKVVVDLFWNSFCQTSNIEAQRVREVVAEFGESIIFREHTADDLETLHCFQTP